MMYIHPVIYGFHLKTWYIFQLSTSFYRMILDSLCGSVETIPDLQFTMTKTTISTCMLLERKLQKGHIILISCLENDSFFFLHGNFKICIPFLEFILDGTSHKQTLIDQILIELPITRKQKLMRLEISSSNSFKALLNPGDVLYVPPYWWHHVQAVTSSGLLLKL